MESLPIATPIHILKQFEEHAKAINRFTSIPIDQAHEQNNEAVKGSGGAVGLAA